MRLANNHVKCCDWDIDNDGNCAIHSSPGVYRHPYLNCRNDFTARQLYRHFNRARNYSDNAKEFIKVLLSEPTTEPLYKLSELWPYGKFVKPINQLATKHLQNIVTQFEEGDRLYVDSEGKQRTEAEIQDLQHRLINVRVELQKRMKNDIREKNTNMSRRIKDAKIQVQSLRDRRGQFHNMPDSSEYQAMLTHLLSLLIDIQLEFNL